jgi:hypothetical protein
MSHDAEMEPEAEVLGASVLRCNPQLTLTTASHCGVEELGSKSVMTILACAARVS